MQSSRLPARIITGKGVKLGADEVLARLVTSFATQDEDIERFVSLCKKS
jgi:DNA-nicking Smr family endonuclease